MTMDAEEYRTICTRPDVIRRPVIEATVRRLSSNHADLIGPLKELLTRGPVPKPPLHHAGSHSDYFLVDLAPDQLEEIVNALGDLEAGLATGAHGSTAELDYTGQLLDTWNRAWQFRRDAA